MSLHLISSFIKYLSALMLNTFSSLLLDHLKKFPVSATGGLMLAKLVPCHAKLLIANLTVACSSVCQGPQVISRHYCNVQHPLIARTVRVPPSTWQRLSRPTGYPQIIYYGRLSGTYRRDITSAVPCSEERLGSGGEGLQ